MTHFNDLGLAKPVTRAIAHLGYETPSPIQAEMIPELLAGHDAIGIAQTGTGKTAAFLLPLLTFLSTLKGRPEKGQCDVLILTPTRELANQIVDNARKYGQFMKFSSCLIVGGARYEGQLRSLARGVNLIVATPGRLMDHMETGAADLSNVSYVVLDEADQMLDMGFVPAIRTIMADVPDNRQTILTSATMPKPIEKLANELLTNPKRIAVSKESEPARDIEQQIIHVDKPQKPMQLLSVLSETNWQKVIIFTRTKRGADKVQVQLIKAGYFAQSLHGDKSFGQRRHIMEEFKSGEVTIMVATDLAGRGLDIDDVSLVINYDLPNIAESYVHRIGRTGRAGREGLAISLVDRSEKAYLREIQKLMGIELPATQSNLPKQAGKGAGGPAGKPASDKRDFGKKAFDKKPDGGKFKDRKSDGGKFKDRKSDSRKSDWQASDGPKGDVKKRQFDSRKKAPQKGRAFHDRDADKPRNETFEHTSSDKSFYGKDDGGFRGKDSKRDGRKSGKKPFDKSSAKPAKKNYDNSEKNTQRKRDDFPKRTDGYAQNGGGKPLSLSKKRGDKPYSKRPAVSGSDSFEPRSERPQKEGRRGMQSHNGAKSTGNGRLKRKASSAKSRQRPAQPPRARKNTAKSSKRSS
ncbi:MAG: DEAD/DEAH box helicase [Candidatus Puniceispirillaceae bacterium]